MYPSTWTHYGFFLFFSSLLNFSFCAFRDRNAREDSFLSPLELPAKYGYPSELHHVVTSDGYILGVYRIPHGKNSSTIGKPVLLHHGILCSSAEFIITGPDQALGYSLADAGYDAWMMNDRGNTYSKNHTYLSTKSMAFWNFDWHEVGVYDIPATFDYILNLTNYQQLTYVGFSQGTTSFYVFASMRPEYNAKIALHIDLAPVVFVTHVRDVPIALLLWPNQPIFTALRLLLGIKDYFPNSKGKGRTVVTNAICDRGDILQPICMKLSTFVQSTMHLNKTTWVAIQGHFPAGASWKQWTHAAQLFNSGHFRQYDYGFIHNQKVYGRRTPPDYALSKVTTPTIFIEGSNDLMAVKKDIDRLQLHLPNLLERHVVADPKFSHFDFVWAVNARVEVYPLVVQKIRQYVGYSFIEISRKGVFKDLCVCLNE